MNSLRIAHIGILVPDLEEAIDRWSAALGYTFSPVARYRTESYVDHSNAEPHFHDARIAISKEGAPFIELMEFHGEGTHGAKNGAGFHHFGFVQTPDVEATMSELADQGIGLDGASILDSGRMHLCFTEPRDLNGMRFEFVSQYPSPIIRDDGTELPRTPEGQVSLWPAPVDATDAPLINHFGVLVADLDEARERWSAATGWQFGPIRHYRTDRYSDFSDKNPHFHDARTSTTTVTDGARLELLEFTGAGTHGPANGEGFHHLAFLEYPSLQERREHFAGLGIGIQGASIAQDGSDLLIFTDPADLDGIRLEIVDMALGQPIFTEQGEPVVFTAAGAVVSS